MPNVKETGGQGRIFIDWVPAAKGKGKGKGRGNAGGRSPPRRQPRQQVLQAAPKGPPNALAAPPPNEAPEAAAPANLAQPLTFLAADMLKETC